MTSDLDHLLAVLMLAIGALILITIGGWGSLAGVFIVVTTTTAGFAFGFATRQMIGRRRRHREEFPR